MKNISDEILEKKSVHVDLPKSTHAKLRIELFKRNLSMQSVFVEFSERVALGVPSALRLLDELVEKKREKKLKQLSDTDAESLFNILEKSSPFGSSKQEQE